MNEQLRGWIRGLRAYRVWRVIRERQQLRRFRTLLDEEVRAAGDLARFSESELTEELLLRGKGRRSLDGGHAPVVAFGTNDWEAYGLWSAFEAAFAFELFDYRVHMRELGHEVPSSLARRELRDTFLMWVDANGDPPALAFLYADAKYVAPDLLKELSARGIWTVLMGLDDKQVFRAYRRAGMIVGQETLVGHADVYWTTWKSGVGAIRRAGGRPWYQAEAAHPDFFRSLDMPRDLEVVFVGGAYGSRVDLVRYLRARGFNVIAVGRGWPGGVISHGEMVELFNRAKVVLGVGDVGNSSRIKHLKARDFEVPMCGALYLTTFNAELCDYYDIGREILCYASLEECAEVLHWVRSNEEDAEQIRARGLVRARSDHTWEKRLSDLLNVFPHAGAAPEGTGTFGSTRS